MFKPGVELLRYHGYSVNSLRHWSYWRVVFMLSRVSIKKRLSMTWIPIVHGD